MSLAQPLVAPTDRAHARTSTCAELPNPIGSTNGFPAVRENSAQRDNHCALAGTVTPTPDTRSVATSAIDPSGLGICPDMTPPPAKISLQNLIAMRRNCGRRADGSMPLLSKLLSCFCADDRTNPPQLGDIGRNRGGTHTLRCRCSVLTHTECDGAPVLASVREGIPPHVRRGLRHASPFLAGQFISSGRGIPGNASGSLSTNKLGSDGLAEPPDYLICAIQLGAVA